MHARNSSPSVAATVNTPASSSGSDQILDCKTMLGSVENDLGLLQELVEIFFAECPGLLAQIRAGVMDSNPETVERSAHTLKGALSNFGALRACEAARELEIRSREARLEDAAELCSRLDAEVAVACNALSDYLRGVKGERPPR